MNGLGLGAISRLREEVTVDAVAGVHVEQVVQAERVVERQRGAGLVAARGLGAAVVQRERQPPLLRLDVLHDQIAVARAGTWCSRRLDLDVGLGGGDALQVLQALFDGAQVQQVAHGRGNGRPQKRSTAKQRQGGLGRQADGGDATGHERQRQGAARQILRCSENARGDPAARDQGRLRTGQHHVDPGGAEAAADGAVRSVSGGEVANGPLE